MNLTLAQITFSRISMLIAALPIAAFFATGHGKLIAGDQPAQFNLDFGTVVVQAGNVWQLAADDAPEAPAEEGPQRIEIGGPLGGVDLPENFKKMMKSAQEMQELKAKYDTAITDLIEEAKKLEDPSGIMAGAAKVAALAREAEQLKTDIDAKQKEMMKQMGGGIGVFGAGGAGGIEIGGFGGGEGGIQILPVFPKGGLPMPRFAPPPVPALE